MVDTKPTTSWALASLVSSILGDVAALALLAVAAGPIADPTGVSGGLAVLFYGFLSVMLGLLGVICGTVALRRIRSGEWGGRGKAWTGIVLGCWPLVVLAGYLIYVMWQGRWDWIGNRGREKQGPI